MLRSRKGKLNIKGFEQIIPVLIIVICILLFRGTGICSGGMGGMNDQCSSNFQCSNRYFCEKNVSDCSGQGTCTDKQRSCPDVWQPVCGCDGSIYPNECAANRRGISINYSGQCVPDVITNCSDNTQCLTGYCQKSDGNCTGQGTCSSRPAVCAQVWEPVCGCDENTYPNECEAFINGVNVLYDGECSPVTVTCTNNNDCLPNFPGSYCQKSDENCTGQGTCAPRPTACAQIYEPVCGCDGVTYSNKCEAEIQGVNVAHSGECQPGGGIACTDNSGCAANSFCRNTAVNCGGQGICTIRPHMCPQVLDPVCGCDGTTYSSECEAASSGVSVYDEGECSTSGAQTCTGNGGCPSGSYCQKTLDACLSQGTCTPAPQECPDIWSPVCGCNGNTYPNECYAAANGINLDSVGECSAATELCIDSNSCSPDEYCQKASGKCNTGEGECVIKPEVCPDLWAPVCGCDGSTYPNECRAALEGVNIDYSGECAGTGPQCLESSNCTTPGTVCQKSPGKCSELGICAPPPTSCPEIWSPVCGCDGNIYSSACIATSQGVAIDYTGQCSGSGTPVSCTDNNPCSADSYCDKSPGDCSGQGTCVPAPTICPAVWEPVCGCNGNTYPNECEASKLGINTDFTGECSAAGMWCQNNMGCPSFAYCKKDSCKVSFGKCTIKPEFCVQVNSPVCSCNGTTYSNACLAAADGANVGSCPTTVQPPPGWPYGGLIGGLYGGGIIGGTLYGGIIGGIIGGYIGGTPYGGIIGGTPYGGYIGGTPYGGIIGGVIGGYIGGTPYGGIIGGTPYGGYIGGTPYGGIIGGVIGGIIGGTTYGGYIGGTPYGGIIGGIIGGYIGGTYPGFGYPYTTSSGTKLPTTLY